MTTKTYANDIYNYLREFNCPLYVRVVDKNNVVVVEGDAIIKSQYLRVNNVSYMVENENVIEDETRSEYTFYADYPQLNLTGMIQACSIMGGAKKKKRRTKKSIKKRKPRTRKCR